MPTFSRFTRYFIEVARLGSMRKASESLHISASAIDRQILQAEEEFGVPLFERLPSGLRLTSAGELLLAKVKEWEKELRGTHEHIDDLRGLRRGHVAIAMIDALSEGFVPEAIAALHQQYPGLSFGLRTARNRDVQQQILANEVDFGLLLDPLGGTDLQVLAFAEIPLGLLMPNDHPLASRPRLHLSEAVPYGLILPAAPLIVHRHAEVLLQRLEIDSQRVINSNDSRMLRSLVRLGVGVGLLSWLDVQADIKAREMTFVPLRSEKLKPMVLSVCTASHRQLSKAAQLTLEALRERIENLRPQGEGHDAGRPSEQ
ncbi:DNA-binding transcriptional regulator, LysR family [Pseudomonas flavescens]|uniref:DNA-binding transcriptional regulator, LysR family n=1 Tax=Phytopseudomonas flavescens TaxID=29435 RepID=A0A1G8J0Z8_9GAMM|nr:LysR family transcriptional regulator [Pseudomonas flavescens]SDI24806.1 DNA-binding transcriptional regulator, LysR family [Pseudomonas flavescens]